MEVGELFDGQYKLLKLLSTSGGTADVWLALDKNTTDLTLESENSDNEDGDQLKVVIKIYRPKNALDIEGEQRFRDEFKIVYNCHHENLLQSTYFSICGDRPYLVMPFCQRGSTETLIRKLKNDRDIWQYIYDASAGIAYLHGRKPPIIHQDIKPANILINDDGRYAITDFGISAQSGHRHNDLFEENSCGTVAYMAPERFAEDAQPNAASDVWALGATFYEIITGNVPFGEDGGSAQTPSTAVPKITENIDKNVKQLIYSCLEYNADKRPTANAIRLMAKKKIEKDKRIKILIVAFAIVLCVAVFAVTMLSSHNSVSHQFDNLHASGDSIVAKIKMGQAVNDSLKLRLSQATTLYRQALKIEIDDAENKQKIENKIKELVTLQNSYEEWQKQKDSVESAKELSSTFEYVVKERETRQDSIEKSIRKIINNL